MPRGDAIEWTTIKRYSYKEKVDKWLKRHSDEWIRYVYIILIKRYSAWIYFSDDMKTSERCTDHVYLCEKAARKRLHYACPAKMRIRYMVDLNDILIQISGEHDHTRINTEDHPDNGLSSPVKDLIKLHIEKTPKAIRKLIRV